MPCTPWRSPPVSRSDSGRAERVPQAGGDLTRSAPEGYTLAAAGFHSGPLSTQAAFSFTRLLLIFFTAGAGERGAFLAQAHPSGAGPAGCGWAPPVPCVPSPRSRSPLLPRAPRREERGDRRRCRAAGDGAAGRGRRLLPAPTAANGRQRSLTAAERPLAMPIGAAHTFGHEASEGKL